MEKFDGLTIGQILKKKREDKGISLEESAATTNISKKFLKAIEEDRFEDLPGSIHSTGFVRLYGSYLELDESFLMELLNRQLRFEQQPPLEEIMELGRQVVRKSDRKFNPMVLIPISLVFIFITLIVIFVLNKSSNPEDASSNRLELNKGFAFDKPVEWEKGKILVLPLENQQITFKLGQISGDLINFYPEDQKTNLFVKKNEYLRYDSNNDLMFDLEIIVNDIKKDSAVITVRKIREARLKDQERFSVGVFANVDNKTASLSEKNESVSAQVAGDVTVQVKNISINPVFAWIVKKSRAEKEELIRLLPGNALDVKLLKDGVLDLDSIDFSDISSFEFKFGNNPVRFNQARGAVGYISFEMAEENGMKKINWKANY